MSNTPSRRTAIEFGDAFEPLLLSARAGEAWAWERIYQWLSPVVAGYIQMQGVREVDDVSSEVWISIFRGIESFSGTESKFRS